MHADKKVQRRIEFQFITGYVSRLQKKTNLMWYTCASKAYLHNLQYTFKLCKKQRKKIYRQVNKALEMVPIVRNATGNEPNCIRHC